MHAEHPHHRSGACGWRREGSVVALLSALVATGSAAQSAPSRPVASAHALIAPERLGIAPYRERAVQAASSPMSCTTARLIMTPLGGAAGAAAGLLLYGFLDLLGDGPEAATDDRGVQENSSDLLRVVLVGGGLGALWGFVAPPIARHCWIHVPGQGPGDTRPPRPGPPKLPNSPDP